MATITVTNLRDRGSGSLRDAIAAAQAGDTIRFSASLANKTITLTSGDIDINKNLIIDGSNAANLSLSGNQKSRIFQIDKYKTVTIKDLNFINGREVVAGDTVGQGGAIKVRDYGTLVVANSTFKNNVAERGGAIQVGYSGRLTVRDSTFDRNDGSVGNDGFSAGAIATYGSGVGDTKGFLVIEDTTFTNNKGRNGGAVYSLLGPVDIKDSVFKNNEARTGGAVFTDGGGVNILNTRVEGNTSQGPGGGLFLWTYNNDVLRIEDTVIDRNTSTGNSGGAMRVGPSGSLILRDSTVSNNSALKQGGGVWVDSKGSVTIEGATFSGNSVTDDVGGGIFMNTPDGTPVKITHSTFVDHASGRDAETIWVNGRNSDDVTLTRTVFAGQGSVNFVMKDGGGNFAENSIGGRRITDQATYVDDVKLGNLQPIGDRLVHVPQAGSPLIKAGPDIGAYDVGSRNAPPAGGNSNPKAIGEYGTFNLNHQWKTISLDASYLNPVVIVSDPTANGGDPAAIRLRNVSQNSFQVRLQEPNYLDGWHTQESVSYVVMEAGNWTLADGTRISAGNHQSNRLTSQGFDGINLKGFDRTPTVLSQVQTFNGSDWVTTRTQGQSANRFQLAMQEEEALNDGFHVNETLGWLAVEQGVASDGDTLLEGSTTGQSYDDDFATVRLEADFDAAPSVIAKLGSYYGGDTANLRLDDISRTSFGVGVQEEKSLDSELNHINESVSFLALEGKSGVLTGLSG